VRRGQVGVSNVSCTSFCKQRLQHRPVAAVGHMDHLDVGDLGELGRRRCWGPAMPDEPQLILPGLARA
jgi:hypothetical protein